VQTIRDSRARLGRLAALLALGLAAAGYAESPPPSPAPALPAPVPQSPGTTQMTQEQVIERLGGGLKSIQDKMRDRATNKMVFSANLFYAHEGMIKHVPADVLALYADALKEAGATRVDMNMGFYPWLDEDAAVIAKYDDLIKHVRGLGLQLALNPQISTRQRQFKTFAEVREAVLKVWPRIAERYQPDIFVVLHEPTTMAGRLGMEVTPREWCDFVRDVGAAVRKVAPKARLGAGFLGHEEKYFTPMLALRELDCVSFDIYDIRTLAAINAMIPRAREAGKAVYLEETWRSPVYTAKEGVRPTLDTISCTGVGLAAFENLDAAWLEALAMYASGWQLEAFTPFWTPAFFKYVPTGGDATDPAYLAAVVDALRKKERTRSFAAYKALAEKYGRAAEGKAGQ